MTERVPLPFRTNDRWGASRRSDPSPRRPNLSLSSDLFMAFPLSLRRLNENGRGPTRFHSLHRKENEMSNGPRPPRSSYPGSSPG